MTTRRMKRARLTVSLALCVPALGHLGCCLSSAGCLPGWCGLLCGGTLGLAFGLILGDALPREVADDLFAHE